MRRLEIMGAISNINEAISNVNRELQKEVLVPLMFLVKLGLKKFILDGDGTKNNKRVKQYIRNNIRKYYETIDRRSDEENLFFKYEGRWYFYKSRAWDVLKLFNKMSGKYLINDSTKLLKYLN